MSNRRQRYREGGVRGWLVVLTAFLAEFIVYGSLKAFGVLVNPMKEDLETDAWIIGSIGALHIGVQFALTPVTAVVACRIKRRSVLVAIGGVLYGLGLILSARATSVTSLALPVIFIAGTGAACVLEVSRAELAFYFYERFPLVNFIVLTGAPAGMMLYGPVTQVLIDTYGWRGAMLILGGFGANLVWAGLLLSSYRKAYAPLPRGEEGPTDGISESQAPVENPTDQSSGKSWRGTLVTTLGLDVFCNSEFILVALARMSYNISYGGVVLYAVPNAIALGLSATEASFLSTAFGVGSLVGLVLSSSMLSAGVLSVHAIVAVSGTLTAVTLFLEAFVSTVFGQAANVFAIGVAMHCVVEVVTVMVKNLPFSDERYVIVLGWGSFLAGASTSVGDVMAGWIYGATGNFHGTFFLLGSAMIATVIVVLVHYIRTIHCRRLSSRNPI